MNRKSIQDPLSSNVEQYFDFNNNNGVVAVGGASRVGKDKERREK